MKTHAHGATRVAAAVAALAWVTLGGFACPDSQDDSDASEQVDPGSAPDPGPADPGQADLGPTDVGADPGNDVMDVTDAPDTGPKGYWRFVELKTGLSNEYVFKGVWAAETGRAVTVGNDGVVAAMEDGEWSVVSVGEGATLLNAVHGVSSADLWAVGKSGAMLHGGAQAMAEATPQPPYPTLWGVYATRPDDAVAVGLAGTIVHYNGLDWTQVSGPGQAVVNWRGMHGSGDSLVLVGENGAIGSTEGGVLAHLPSPTLAHLNDVHTSDGSVYYAVGELGTVLRGEGSNWVLMNSPTFLNLYGVFATGPDEFFMAGDGGTLYHYVKPDWIALDAKTSLALRTIWVAPSGYTVLSGSQGVLIDGSAAGGFTNIVDLYKGAWLNDAYGFSESDIVLVGEDSKVFHKNLEGGWPEDNTPTTQHLRAVWGSGGNDIWAVGLAGKIIHYDGVKWTEADSPTTAALEAVWGTGPANAYAAGAGGTLIRWDGVNWNVLSSSTDQNLRAVFGHQPTDMWAVGVGGTIMRFSGLGWSTVLIQPKVNSDFSEEPIVDDLHGIWGAAADDIWAVGDKGQVVYWDGEEWNSRDPGFGVTLRAVYGRASDDVVAVGSQGFAIHWNGYEWTPVMTESIATLYAVHGDGAGQLLAVGDIGTVLRWTFIPVE